MGLNTSEQVEIRLSKSAWIKPALQELDMTATAGGMLNGTDLMGNCSMMGQMNGNCTIIPS